MHGYEFYIDQSRCIGCQSCVNACTECGTHRGVSMIHLDFIDREWTTATTPTVCMHCEDPACAQSCPADAIKKGEDGVVRSALKPRCIACSNCVLACPFGIPKVHIEPELMMKCDMCYDRTSVGLRPMCAMVCPSQALSFGPPEEVRKGRSTIPVNDFRFGNEHVRTKVSMMLPSGSDALEIDVQDYMWKESDASDPWLLEEAFVD